MGYQTYKPYTYRISLLFDYAETLMAVAASVEERRQTLDMARFETMVGGWMVLPDIQ